MFKKTVIFLLCALPMFAMAQNKLGHINTGEVMQAMPEIAGIHQAISELESEYESVLMQMQEEFLTKLREFQERQATMPESIREMRQSELADLEQRIFAFRQTANDGLRRRQMELLAPVVERVRNAIEAVGTEHGFTYIFDLTTESIVFQSPTANNVTPLVKARLGIR